jgi:hypothetical protein
MKSRGKYVTACLSILGIFFVSLEEKDESDEILMVS